MDRSITAQEISALREEVSSLRARLEAAERDRDEAQELVEEMERTRNDPVWERLNKVAHDIDGNYHDLLKATETERDEALAECARLRGDLEMAIDVEWLDKARGALSECERLREFKAEVRAALIGFREDSWREEGRPICAWNDFVDAIEELFAPESPDDV